MANLGVLVRFPGGDSLWKKSFYRTEVFSSIDNETRESLDTDKAA